MRADVAQRVGNGVGEARVGDVRDDAEELAGEGGDAWDGVGLEGRTRADEDLPSAQLELDRELLRRVRRGLDQAVDSP